MERSRTTIDEELYQELEALRQEAKSLEDEHYLPLFFQALDERCNTAVCKIIIKKLAKNNRYHDLRRALEIYVDHEARMMINSDDIEATIEYLETLELPTIEETEEGDKEEDLLTDKYE